MNISLKEYIQNLWATKAQGTDYLKGTPIVSTNQLSVKKYSIKERHISESFVCRISHPSLQWPLVCEYITANNKIIAWQMSFNPKKKQFEIYLSFDKIPSTLCYRFALPETSIPSKKMPDPDFDTINIRKGIGVCSLKTHMDIEWLTPELIPVYIEPIQSKLFIDQQTIMGEKKDISLDVNVSGNGTLDIALWGDGIVSKTQQIKKSKETQTIKISFCLDTNQLTSLDTSNIDLYIQTNSRVVNKRYFSIPIQLNNFYYIHCYPVNRINWLLDDVTTPCCQQIQIKLKGSSESGNHMQINIPETLSAYIGFEIVDVVNGKINFYLNKDQVKPGKKIDDCIHVHFLLESNKQVTAEIPVCIYLPNSHSSVSLKSPPRISNDLIRAVIQNKDKKYNCIIRSIKWKKNKFSYVCSKNSNNPDHWPIISPESSQTLHFRLNQKAPWIFSSRLKDEITIHTNSEITPEFKQKIELSIQPVVWQKIKGFFS